MDVSYLLRRLGLSDKEIGIYLTLLTEGPSSVRKLAKESEINRGTAYDALKSLQKSGLVGMYQKHKKQFFVAEDPGKLAELIEQREQALSSMKRHVADVLPELRSLYVHGGMKPVVKYYEGAKGVRIILRDLLTTMSEGTERRLYRVYSSAGLREYMYKEFPDFTKERIKRDIEVRAIAVGAGGEDQPLAERRWIRAEGSSFTYTLIYGQKVAFISLGEKDQIHGVLIEDPRITETERMVFDHVWMTLGSSEQKGERSARDTRMKQPV